MPFKNEKIIFFRQLIEIWTYHVKVWTHISPYKGPIGQNFWCIYCVWFGDFYRTLRGGPIGPQIRVFIILKDLEDRPCIAYILWDLRVLIVPSGLNQFLERLLEHSCNTTFIDMSYWKYFMYIFFIRRFQTILITPKIRDNWQNK